MKINLTPVRSPSQGTCYNCAFAGKIYDDTQTAKTGMRACYCHVRREVRCAELGCDQFKDKGTLRGQR